MLKKEKNNEDDETKSAKNITFIFGRDFESKTGFQKNIFDVAKVLAKENKVTLASPEAKENKVCGGVKIVKLNNSNDLELIISRSDCVVPIFGFSSSCSKPLSLSVAAICSQIKKQFFQMFITTEKNSLFNNVFGISDFYAGLNELLI